MCCSEEWELDEMEQKVIEPLREAREQLDWVIKTARYKALSPEKIRQCIAVFHGKVRDVDGYLRGLIHERVEAEMEAEKEYALDAIDERIAQCGVKP